jgi:isochorismate hydrolase
VTGVQTCALPIFMRGFSVFIVVDGTATWNRELHHASLRGLAHGCAVLFLTGDLLAACAKHPC